LSLPSPKEFYERFKDDPEGARRAAFGIGREFEEVLLRRSGAQGDGLEVVVAVLNEFQRAVQGEPSARVEGDRVTMRCTGFCPITRASMTLNIPWIWLDANMAWPMIRGIASTIVPDIRLRVPQAKSKGDATCVYVFETG